MYLLVRMIDSITVFVLFRWKQRSKGTSWCWWWNESVFLGWIKGIKLKCDRLYPTLTRIPSNCLQFHEYQAFFDEFSVSLSGLSTESRLDPGQVPEHITERRPMVLGFSFCWKIFTVEVLGGVVFSFQDLRIGRIYVHMYHVCIINEKCTYHISSMSDVCMEGERNGCHPFQSKSPWKDAKGRFTKCLSTKLDVRIVLPCYFYSKEMMHLVWLKKSPSDFPGFRPRRRATGKKAPVRVLGEAQIKIPMAKSMGPCHMTKSWWSPSRWSNKT